MYPLQCDSPTEVNSRGYALHWAWKCNKIKGICCLLTEYKTASNPTSSFNLQALGSCSATREIAKDMIEIKKQ